MHTRRRFLQAAAGTTALGALTRPRSLAAASGGPKFQLGIVTYNIAANWDLATILRILSQTKIGAVEFRTQHKHGVEPSLSSDQRKEVRKKCQDAGVAIWGCGTICEFHDPDRAKVEQQVETC